MSLLNPRMTRRTFAGLSAAVVARAVVGGEPAAPAVPSPAPGAAGTAASGEPAAWTSAAVPRNIQVSVDAFAAHIEPSLAVNQRDPRNLLAACRVFQDSLIGLATYVSFDAGLTWHGNGLLPGVVPDFDGNASVAFDRHGRGYVCAIQATTAQPRHGNAYVWRTDDGGRSFSSPVTAISAGAGVADHPSLVISRPQPPQPAPLHRGPDVQHRRRRHRAHALSRRRTHLRPADHARRADRDTGRHAAGGRDRT